jgi:hypothetical protein
MNKTLKSLLIAAFAIGSMNAATNKTFFMPRSQGVNLPMEYTTFNELIHSNNGDIFGTHFQAVPFYLESCDKDNLGRYFGFESGDVVKNIIKIGGTDVTDRDLYYARMFHSAAPYRASTAASIKLEPKLEAYGLRMDYYQDLGKALTGLYFKVSCPIVQVETNMNLDETITATGFFATPSDSGTDAVKKYFNGTYGEGVPAVTGQLQKNSQRRLQYAKMGGKHSESAVADIDLVLGQKFFDKERYYVALNLGLTIPVGNTPDARWVFEPVVGNGNHWAFGGGLDFSWKFWEKKNRNLKLTGVANYRYLFDATEVRTLGLKKDDGTPVNWGQYRLAARVGDEFATPTANILSKDVTVKPGSQLDAMLYLTYNNGNWTADLGYNFFYKESENVDLKAHDFEADDYAILHTAYVGTTAVAATDFATEASATTDTDATTGGSSSDCYYLNRDHVDTRAAETPSMDTHKIFGSLGYNWKEWEYPLMLGIGGGYEFAGNDGVENWQVYGKIGMKF